MGGSPSIKYDESHHTAPELEDRHRSHESARRPAAALLPAPAHGAIVGHVGSFPDLIPHIPADRTAHGGPGQDRRAAAKMPFRSAIRLAYSLHMRCRDLPWTDTSAVRSLTHTEQRNRCGLAALGALATRHGPHASRVAVARPPAGLRIDFGQAGPDAEHGAEHTP